MTAIIAYQISLINSQFPMPGPGLEVLYEDNHLLAVCKPAGLATMGAPGGQTTLLTLAKQYIKQRYHKPGNVYLGVVSRVDAPVTGVVLLARTSKAAGRLSEQFRTRTVSKVYWAIVEGVIEPAEAECVDWLVKDDAARRMRVVEAETRDAQEARLGYRRLGAAGPDSLVEVELHTGRKHQIRVQFAHRGHPIVGDAKYGSRRRFPAGIALHARRLVFLHPTKSQPIELLAPLPAAWRRLGVREP
jgi:23S rRNA pseudouridine1911/1915/1917 synthase